MCNNRRETCSDPQNLAHPNDVFFLPQSFIPNHSACLFTQLNQVRNSPQTFAVLLDKRSSRTLPVKGLHFKLEQHCCFVIRCTSLLL